MDFTNLNGLWILKVDMIQAVAFAVMTYYFGTWLKSKILLLRRLSVSSPVVGGIIVAITLSILEGMGILRVEFDTTLQKQLMLAFFTTIGLMASLKIVRKGGLMLVFFLVAVSTLAVMQNVLGMSLASMLGLDARYGIMVGSVSLMGGLGTSAAFGPYFEQTYGLTGATAVAITSATFAMTNSLITGGPIGEWLLRRHKVPTPKQTASVLQEDRKEHIEMGNSDASNQTWTPELMRAIAIVLVCMALGTVVSKGLSHFITLPAYIGAMIVACVVRNIGDIFGFFDKESKAINAVAEISLVLFVTMAINGLKLHELVHLAIPLFVILVAQFLMLLLFARWVLFQFFGKDFDAVMLTVGGCGFCMGATSTGLTNMQGLAEKYGPSPKAYLIVSLVGAFLIDFINALVITWFGAL